MPGDVDGLLAEHPGGFPDGGGFGPTERRGGRASWRYLVIAEAVRPSGYACGVDLGEQGAERVDAAVPCLLPGDHAGVDAAAALGPVDRPGREHGVHQGGLDVIRPAARPPGPFLTLTDGRVHMPEDPGHVVRQLVTGPHCQEAPGGASDSGNGG